MKALVCCATLLKVGCTNAIIQYGITNVGLEYQADNWLSIEANIIQAKTNPLLD